MPHYYQLAALHKNSTIHCLKNNLSFSTLLIFFPTRYQLKGKVSCFSLAVVLVHFVLSAVAKSKSGQVSHFTESKKQEEEQSPD